MYTLNDPMLALILRFAGRKQDIAFSDEEFLRRQVEAIQEYIGQHPPEEQEMRAIEWIAMRARQYRKIWEKESLTDEVSSHRCADCPLADSGTIGHCEIHEQWLELIHQYMADDINSREYIESALELLARNKEHLKIKHGMLKKRGVS